MEVNHTHNIGLYKPLQPSDIQKFEKVEYLTENGIYRKLLGETNYLGEPLNKPANHNKENNRMMNIYSYVATIIIGILILLFSCIVVLLMFYVNSQRKSLLIYGNIQELSPKFHTLPLNGISTGGQHLVSSKDWSFVENLGNQEEIIHFTVKQDISLIQNRHPGYLTGTVEGRSIKISGRPKFCHVSDFSAPQKLNFNNIDYVHLSDMEDCHHYVYLILNEWNFPKVQGIKLERMQIEKEDFFGVTKFIERHNETLTKVEIHDSYICSSPVCDAGMIDFPNHDFQVIITGRLGTSSSV